MENSRTLIDVIEHLRRMYGLRNGTHHDSRDNLINILDYGLYELDQSIAGKTERTYEVSCASLFALAIALLDDLSRVERSIGKSLSTLLIEVLSKKYPGYCLYCNEQGKCGCPEVKRAKPNWKDREVDPKHLSWTITNWQQAWKATYGEKNQARGFEATVRAISSEVREIRRVRIIYAESHMPSLEILENYIEEIADFLARLSAFASLHEVNIDLDAAIWNRYGLGCPKCHELICRCTIYRSSVKAYYSEVAGQTSMPRSVQH